MENKGTFCSIYEMDINESGSLGKMFLVNSTNYGRDRDIFMKVINDVLHDNDTAEGVIYAIKSLMPNSRRDWKGKPENAIFSDCFISDTSELLTLTIKTKKPYNYLYFPDDGSNTKNHQGNQHFMKRGADASVSSIAQLCAAQLTDAL